MNKYIVIEDHGYDGYAVRWLDSDKELFEAMQDSSFEMAFHAENEIGSTDFKTKYLECIRAEEDRKHELRLQAKAKLTREEIEALGL